MYFNEGRFLSHPRYTHSEICNPVDAIEPSNHASRRLLNPGKAGGEGSGPERRDAKTPHVLAKANNRLQELMQILYLLSRDPAVPNDARHHVTVAQSEIALLARVMQNSADEGTPPLPATKDVGTALAHP